MTLLFVFVGTLFTIYALWLTIAPFLTGVDESLRLEHLDQEVQEIELLVAQREVLLVALRELDFDRETHKLSVEDYERFRSRYENQAVAILKRLDEIHGGRDWRERVNAEVAERLGREPRLGVGEVRAKAAEADPEPDEAAEPTVPQKEEEEEEEVDVPTDTADDDADGEGSDAAEELDDEGDESDGADEPACVSCGEALEPEDRFCSQCGTPVGLKEVPQAPAKSEASA